MTDPKITAGKASQVASQDFAQKSGEPSQPTSSGKFLTTGEDRAVRRNPSVSRANRTSIGAASNRSSIDDTGPSAEHVRKALKHSATAKDTVILACGYSPTGGGHTARCLDVIQASIDKGHVKPGSTLIFNVPQIWEGKPRSKQQLDKIAAHAKAQGIEVLLVQADKSVMGYLKPSGASDDAKIIDRFAKHAARPTADISHIEQARIYGEASDFDNPNSISGKHLGLTLKELIGEKAMGERVKVFTDMDHDLLKGMLNAGVSPNNAVDQQNHAILLEGEVSKDVVDKNALLAKVLSSRGAKISHIGLGDKNTLIALSDIAKSLGITADTTKKEAMRLVAQELLEHGNIADPQSVWDNRSGMGAVKPATGVLKHPSIKSADQVKNVMYVYAHGNQTLVGAEIQKQIARGDLADDAYRNTLFVLCGFDTLRKGDGMKLSYLADGDGITTSGAGTNGEFAYLHKAGDSKSGLLALPIIGHNEQQKNAEYLKEKDPATMPFTVIGNARDEESLRKDVDAYVKDRFSKIEEKMNGLNMRKTLEAVGDTRTYVDQSVALLFGGEMSAESKQIVEVEKAMIDSPELQINRRYYKTVFTAIDQMVSMLSSPQPDTPINIRLASKESTRQYESVREFAKKVLKNEDMLGGFLAADKRPGVLDRNLNRVGLHNVPNVKLPHFDEVKSLFENAASTSGATPSKLRTLAERIKEKMSREYRAQAIAPSSISDRTKLRQDADALKEEFGETYTTGF
ncbi:hypothetical protein [Ramlibacter tataouinensis]|uniref:Uncharacterized protein n=1 Tax=Ramlibacter tataouinensis (strain ATCC BAA-407 / DSM 14655 / LMG 21543 / TTB310) TaxID=365046 RepID=F5XW09_RAMTT|nr:hypothetical protein [Ramlibacter tataouinensis]AEG94112.1 hypothetical protein Rta_30040 [Ramlibacter tataouinensis TTB310]